MREYGVQASVGGYLKRNFREFHAYSGPERRQSPRTPVADNGAAASRAVRPALRQARDDQSAQRRRTAALGHR